MICGTSFFTGSESPYLNGPRCDQRRFETVEGDNPDLLLRRSAAARGGTPEPGLAADGNLTSVTCSSSRVHDPFGLVNKCPGGEGDDPVNRLLFLGWRTATAEWALRLKPSQESTWRS